MVINLGGNIPKWLMRITAATGPYRTVKSLLVQVQRPKYKKTHPSVFQDP